MLRAKACADNGKYENRTKFKVIIMGSWDASSNPNPDPDPNPNLNPKTSNPKTSNPKTSTLKGEGSHGFA